MKGIEFWLVWIDGRLFGEVKGEGHIFEHPDHIPVVYSVYTRGILTPI